MSYASAFNGIISVEARNGSSADMSPTNGLILADTGVPGKGFSPGGPERATAQALGGISDSGALPRKAAIATFPHRLSAAGVTLLF